MILWQNHFLSLLIAVKWITLKRNFFYLISPKKDEVSWDDVPQVSVVRNVGHDRRGGRELARVVPLKVENFQ